MQFLRSDRTIGLLTSFLMLGVLASVTSVQPVQSKELPGELTGNIGVVSKYVFRGGVESDRATVQGGFDYSHPSGAYLGYWGSGLDYPSTGTTSFENDVYGGYSASSGAVSYDLGVIQYAYSNDRGSDATDVYGSVGYGPVSLSAAYALQDASWINEGELYTSLSFARTIAYGFDVNAKVGYQTYEDEATNLSSTESGNLRDIVVGISHAIGESPATMSLDYIVPGDDRNDASVGEEQVVLGVTYNFGIAK